MANDNFTIKQWAQEDRPREKMLEKGVRTLSNAELLAILIGSGNKEMTAVDLSKKILGDVDNNLYSLGQKTINDLISQYNGVGEAKAVSILAALELGRRRQSQEAMKQAIITGSASVAEIFMPMISDLPHEEFWVLFLNRANKVIGMKNISQGGVSGTIVDVKLVFQAALEKLASAIILCHNHPSGSITPSQHDFQITNKCVEAGKVLDVTVFDHLIVGHNDYYSFSDNGKI